MSDSFADVRWIWKNGQLIDFEKATVHVLSHALHYGSGVFEGIRCYNTSQGSAVFRLREHIRRLESSAKVYRMPVAFTTDELMDAVCETIRANELEACYIRPIIFRGFGKTVGVNPLQNPVEVFIACWPWDKYLGEEAESGVDVCVSSWRRISADSMPAVAKATGNYLNAQLIKVEAITNGYVEGIALDAHGYVSEGSGENVFMVQDGVLMTPPLAASVLQGITRDAVLQIAVELGIPVRQEQLISRGQLYTCEELFMTGTAAEITPIRSVDRNPVGRGCPGEITRKIMERFRGIVTGKIEDRHGWLHAVHHEAKVQGQAEARVPAAAAAPQAR
ncbi:MAG TPA: branched-chain amino acid transaminase [Thermoanaerobaculia bacterium]|nr:branched-chain amino acid transaminase [Thermoanaerobaculia bacterium]